MKFAVVLILLCLGLGACGQKGPLFLPQPAKPQPEVQAPSAEAPAAQAEPVLPKADQPKTELPVNPAD